MRVACRITSLLALPFLFLCCAHALAVDFIRGDVNGDGRVSIADAHHSLLWAFVGNVDSPCVAASDVNGDGTAGGVSDPIGILVYLFLAGKQPCGPFPDSGPDAITDLPCESYGGGQPIDDPAASLTVGDAVAGADGIVELTVRASWSRPIAGGSLQLSVAGGIFANGTVARPVLLFAQSVLFRGGGILGEDLRAGFTTFTPDGSSLGSALLQPAADAALFSVRAALNKSLAPGTYALSVVAAELVDGESGRSIIARAQAGSVTVPPNLPPDAGQEDQPDPDQSNRCPPLGSPDPPDPPGPPVVWHDFLRGDANVDGVLSLSDALMMRRFNFIGGVELTCRAAADANGDGQNAGLADAITVVLHIFRPDTTPIPPPFPQAGPPRPEDVLGCESYEVQPPVETDDAIRLGDVEAAPGELARIPVYVTNTVPIEGFQLFVEHDPAAIELVAVPHKDGDDRANWHADQEGSFYGSIDPEQVINEGGGSVIIDASIAPGVFGFGLLPSLTTEMFQLPPGDDELAFYLFGRVSPEAPAGATISLTLSNGPGGLGWGVERYRNELTHRGGARYASIRPRRLIAGALKISPEIIVFVRGDADGDGTVALVDALRVLNHLFVGAKPFPCPDAADANDDGEIDIADALAILISLYVDRQVLPKPFPSSGRDPTEDFLEGCR